MSFILYLLFDYFHWKLQSQNDGVTSLCICITVAYFYVIPYTLHRSNLQATFYAQVTRWYQKNVKDLSHRISLEHINTWHSPAHLYALAMNNIAIYFYISKCTPTSSSQSINVLIIVITWHFSSLCNKMYTLQATNTKNHHIFSTKNYEMVSHIFHQLVILTSNLLLQVTGCVASKLQ